MTLNHVPLQADGVYTIQVQARTGQAAATGNYVVTAWNATTNEFALNFAQTEIGNIVTPATTDDWDFSATAGQQVQFQMVNAATGICFQLTGPNGFVAFDGLRGDSPVVTLPSSGSYVLTAYSTDGDIGGYAFQFLQTLPTNLAMNTPYQGTLAGSGEAQIFQMDVTESDPLVVQLNDASSADWNELYLQLGSPPTRSDYGYCSGSPASADQTVLSAEAARESGTCCSTPIWSPRPAITPSWRRIPNWTSRPSHPINSATAPTWS